MDRSLNAVCIAIVSGVIGLGALPVGFGLWFAPGWANCGPAIPQNVIWPIGLTVIVTAGVLALTVGGGAALCEAAGGEARVFPPTGWYRGWLLASLMITAVATWTAHSFFRAQALALWP